MFNFGKSISKISNNLEYKKDFTLRESKKGWVILLKNYEFRRGIWMKRVKNEIKGKYFELELINFNGLGALSASFSNSRSLSKRRRLL